MATSARRRHGRLVNVWMSDGQKERLDDIARSTLVNRSEIVRKALDLLFEKLDSGQLTLGFPELTEQPNQRLARG